MESTSSERNELPCIWVLAGVLSYRLCDRNYDCENCELYRALRGHGRKGVGEDENLLASMAPIESLVSSYVCRLTAGCELHLDRPYCPCHFWLQRSPDERVVLGLDGHLLRVLYPVEDITVPHVGVLLKRGEPCGWITRGRVAIPLTSPITGEVEAANEDYIKQVRARGGMDGGDDWLLELKAHEDLDSVPGLYRGEQTLAWYLKEIQLLKRYLREALVKGVDDTVGVTMSDGGEPNLDLEQVLGRERFETLVDQMFHTQIEE